MTANARMIKQTRLALVRPSTRKRILEDSAHNPSAVVAYIRRTFPVFITWREIMLPLPQSANIYAALLLPDGIPLDIELLIFSSLILVVAAALYGARITAASFGWKRIAGAILGVAMGIVLSPLALGLSCLLVNLTARYTNDALPPADTGLAITSILFFLMTSSIAYFTSKIGRPARVAPNMMMETFNRNLLEIEEIVRGKLSRLGGEVGPGFDVGAAQTAGILSQDQAGRLESILRMQHQLQHASSVLHSDVEMWARKSCELLDEIRKQLATNRDPTIVAKESEQHSLENGNPYRPPAS